MTDLLCKRYSSTVFMCETTEDDRYVRCDFKQCIEHPLNTTGNIPVSYWLLNTPKNCVLLEKHVTTEIKRFVNTVNNDVNLDEYELNTDLVERNVLSTYTKVFLVLNICSPQSNYGNWVDGFLKAAALNQGNDVNFISLTLSFSSRLELLEKIQSLVQIVWNPNCEIMVLLSCHSSSQGQVFSCTPVDISEKYGFEEFCSIHNFVCACQDILSSKLKVVHISSCFSLKLNESHLNWPVDSDWLKSKLTCILSGSAKEVYETGSQTADLYLVSRVILSQENNMQDTYKKVFNDVSYHLFPDLVLEMGLCYIDPRLVDAMIKNPDKDDEVTTPIFISSSVQLVIVLDEMDVAAAALKNALLLNLKTRFLDFNYTVTIASVDNAMNGNISTEEMGKNGKFFFLVLSLINDFNSLVERILWWCNSTTRSLYGIHLYNLNMAQPLSYQSKTNMVEVTAFMTTEPGKVHLDCFPVLLYLVHLVLGENGIKAQTTAIAESSNKTGWTLTDVFNEVTTVLVGLCKSSNLILLDDTTSSNLTLLDDTTSSNLTLLDDTTSSNLTLLDDTTSWNLTILDDTTSSNLTLLDDTTSSNLTLLDDTTSSNLTLLDDTTKDPMHADIITSEINGVGSPSETAEINGVGSPSEAADDQEVEPVKLNTMKDASEMIRSESGVESTGRNQKKDGISILPGVFDSNLKDVPLMANVNEVLVHHYALNLNVTFDDKCIQGTELLFLKPACDEVAAREFQMCLDCTLIDILSVEEVLLPEDFEIHFHQDRCCCPKAQTDYGDTSFCPTCSLIEGYKPHQTKELNFRTLPYAVYGWCIRIWNVDSSKKHWPRCVAINYKTKPIGPSLTWCKDKDGNDCCYTPGAFINNRSMMPCQEPPVAMATWQATISVPEGYMALSSGDLVHCKKKGLKATKGNDIFCFEMSVPLPSSTLAFAFGKFAASTKTITIPCSPDNKLVPVTLYSVESKIEAFEKEFHELATRYLQRCCSLLGSYPFSRLDLVVMPRSFACMGLKSPNMMFLSQSVLCGDESMSTRIAHEISHAWFGLLVGAKDWTEEWLSEGFATYIEDRVVYLEKESSEKGFHDYSGLLQVLRLKVLDGELQQTEDENLKKLRPKRNQNYMTAVEAVNENIHTEETHVRPYQTVPNAAIASKKWSQVHYLKGYFLLTHMSQMVGLEKFDVFLGSYLEKYKSQLITSEMFFDYYTTYFSLSSDLKKDFVENWLESANLPKNARVKMAENMLIKQVEQEFNFWKKNNATNKRCRARGLKRKSTNFKQNHTLTSNQLVLLLEMLLNVDHIIPQTLTQFNIVYGLVNGNAEVRHRWCELIIKHGCSTRYDQVKRFLLEDQGMGIYLFGELMLWNRSGQQAMAKELFASLKGEMDKSTRETVHELIEPSAE